jgi:proline dehydrogenase
MRLMSRLVVATLPLVPKFIVGKVAARYVAGETRQDAMDQVRQLNTLGAMATVDVLGEEVTERSKAEAAVEEYIGIFDTIQELGVDANVSIKLTMLGLKIDEAFCLANVDRIAAAAAAHGNFVRLDMEDHTCHDATLRIYHQLQQRHGNLGVVLQSYMRRAHQDIAELPAEGASVRLCKGIYIEPREVAWKGREVVQLNFLSLLDKLFQQGVYVGIATHDEYLICGASALIDRYGLSREQYEFQMLLGVDEQLRDLLLAAGHRLRIYVPYGVDWYRYSLRRLRENPEVAGHVMRAMLSRNHKRRR